MIDDQTILLRQILYKLKQQKRFLSSISKRLKSMEITVGRGLFNMESTIDHIHVRGN